MSTPATILIVDDNPINLKLVADVLECEGHLILRAWDAEQALKILKHTTPELILMDIQMPGMDGLTLTRLLKANPSYQHVHIVALTESKEKTGGTLGFGAKAVQLNSINDLNGKIVVAAGGSFITAQVIRLQTEIGFQVIEMKSAEEAIAAVVAGTASAAVLVGGAPLGQVAALDRTFKLLSIPEATVTKLKNVYKPSLLSYTKMGAAGVTSVSTDSLFVSREYKTAKFTMGLSKLRACITQSLPELAETTGLHPAWSKVDLTNHGKWPYYQLEEVTAKK